MEKGAATLARDELYECIRGKEIALMMNTTAIDNERRLLIDIIANEPEMTVEFCDALKKHESVLPIAEKRKKGAEKFKKAREKYLLY